MIRKPGLYVGIVLLVLIFILSGCAQPEGYISTTVEYEVLK